MEPKKNLSIRGMAGMAANALQKANEDNARKDRRESIEVIVAGNRALPIDLDGAIPKKRDFDRDSTGNNLATTPTSLLSRMDDGKVTQEVCFWTIWSYLFKLFNRSLTLLKLFCFSVSEKGFCN
jgi:hypothetical protein